MQHCHTKRASSLLAKPSSSAVCLQFRRSLFFHLRPHRFYSGCMMSKNSNSNSSDTEELEMPLPIANQTEADLVKPESSRARKLKTMLGVLLIVGVVAAVGVCAAVFAPTKKDERKAQDLDLETRESLYQKMAASQRLARNARKRGRSYYNNRIAATCESTISNDTIPAAHIAGKGLEWPTTQAPTALTSRNTDPADTPGYQTSWSCRPERNGAFVDGGMIFNQTDRKLYVPKCGYYYVSSQVFFQVAEIQTQSVRHNVKVDRNCQQGPQRDFSLQAQSSIGAGQRMSNGNINRGASSTYIGEIVKICTGGKIWVEIPQQDAPCCPYGLNTYLGAYLVAETNCRWPLTS